MIFRAQPAALYVSDFLSETTTENKNKKNITPVIFRLSGTRRIISPAAPKLVPTFFRDECAPDT